MDDYRFMVPDEEERVERQAIYDLLVYGKTSVNGYEVRVLRTPGTSKVELRKGTKSIKIEPLAGVMSVLSDLLYNLQRDGRAKSGL